MIYLDFQKKLYSTQGEVLLKVQCSLKMRELITLFGKSGAGKQHHLTCGGQGEFSFFVMKESGSKIFFQVVYLLRNSRLRNMQLAGCFGKIHVSANH